VLCTSGFVNGVTERDNVKMACAKSDSPETAPVAKKNCFDFSALVTTAAYWAAHTVVTSH